MKAAKEKVFLLLVLASALFVCAPSFASSTRVLLPESRAEIFLLDAQKRTGQQAFDAAKRVENYDSAREVASESPVAPNRGLTPSSFNLATVAENPQTLRMWNDALKSASTSRRANGYTRYLEAIDRGDTISQQGLEEAFGAVNSRFLKSARAAGHDVAEVHHWNFGKTDFPSQVVDPRHLVPTPTRAVHQQVHRATSSTTDIWSGPVAPQHQIPIPEWSTPLAPWQ